jgi:hypothetical protein
MATLRQGYGRLTGFSEERSITVAIAEARFSRLKSRQTINGGSNSACLRICLRNEEVILRRCEAEASSPTGINTRLRNSRRRVLRT